ncbi:MAG: Crp/Fnr family transcriptional regulator [Proteobacteria bacterium]|nr:Crp/Fnr family transcriptional regulator [Pseudomonadota bacterium]MBI3497776.1 Crp/Fnr family transcriptional regulator [Pseudomonadota bacterium]
MSFEYFSRTAFPKGGRIFTEGDAGHHAYIVESGMVEIFREIDGRKTVLGTIAAGGIFGEMALIDRSSRVASAAALETTELIVIPDLVFQEKLAAADPFLRGLLRVLVRNVRSLVTTHRPGDEV